ncbi:MAG TPA: hypothetical protein VFZ59_27935, partial [Verrucomicrobiae bacterium]|nr:hypothetical protein [Verrucomicrobiae bacterium]
LTSLDIDTRSDIYSLGVLLYELLTGRTPFDQNELLAGGIDEMRRTILEKEPLKPSTRLNTLAADALTATAQHRHIDAPKLIHVIRGDLDWIVMKCLEKDRSRRYETANGLASDIGRYLKNEPIVARPPSKLYEFQKTVRRHRLGFALTTVIGLLLLLGVVSLSLSNARIRREQKQKEDALEAATRNEQEAQRQLFTSLKKQAEARRYSRQVGQRTESLAAIVAAAKIQKDDELRDIAIAAMAVSDLRPGPSWQLLRSNDVAVAFDANYQRYAAVDEAGTIMIRSIPDGIELQRFESGPPALPIIACRGLEFSPDGRLLAKLESGYQWSVWRLTDAQLLFRTASEGCSSIAFSRDSKRLAVGTTNEIAVFATETGQELKRWSVPEMPHHMQFSPGDSLLAVGPTVRGANPTITRIYQADSGRLLKELPTHSTYDQSVSWHPSGRYLAATCILTIQLWDVEAAVKVSEMQRHANLVTAVAFSPDGTLVISDSWDDVPRLWSPSPGQELVHCFSGNNFFRFSPDGRWAGAMWTRTGEARLLEVIPSREYQTFLASRHDAEASFQLGDISPRGDLLALSSSTVVSLRELPSGKEIATIPLGYVGAVKFTPDGNSLITCGPTSGLQVWPFTPLNPESKLRLGPPRKIPLPFAPLHLSLDHKGKTAAFVSERLDVGGLVDLATGNLHATRFHHPDISYVALSPNGQWLATSGWHSTELRVWNTETGELVMHQRQQRCFPTFTPDGSELIVAMESGFSFYSTNSWCSFRQTIPAKPGFTAWPAFSRDGTMMALGTSPGTIKIMETSTSRVLAKLEDPHGHVPLFMGFANGDTQLLAMSSSARAIHRWDLRAIRAHLKDMGLDWDWPEFPGISSARLSPIVLEVQSEGLP